MIIKPYQENLSLQKIRSLIMRFDLTAEGKQLYANLEKGNEGESHLSVQLEHLSDNWIIIYDLMLEYKGTIFQIDALLMNDQIIHLFEVKHYEGDFYVEGDSWFTTSGKEIQNPVLQLSRSESLLRQLLNSYDMHIPVIGRIIFTHPAFTLYQAPVNLPIVLPTQIRRFVQKLETVPIHLNSRTKNFAEKLVALHRKESPFNRIPHYTYNHMKKGVTCVACNSLSTLLKNRMHVECTQCGHCEAIDESILRSIKQYQLLFADKKITTSVIQDWCKIFHSKKQIRRVLSLNFCSKGKGKYTYYI